MLRPAPFFFKNSKPLQKKPCKLGNESQYARNDRSFLSWFGGWEIGAVSGGFFGAIISGSHLDKRLSPPQFVPMKIAKKSSQSRQTLTLSRPAFDILDMLRGELPKSVFVQELLEKEKLRREREVFYRDAVAPRRPTPCGGLPRRSREAHRLACQDGVAKRIGWSRPPSPRSGDGVA